MKHIYQQGTSQRYVSQSQGHLKIWCLYTLVAIFSLAYQTAWTQLTIRITGVPTNTPINSAIYVAGTFNNWNPADPAREMMPIGGGKYIITINPAPGQVEFKFTRGTWETVEGNIAGLTQPSHKVFYNGQPKTIEVVILSWPDVIAGGGGNITPVDGSVEILDNNFYIPELSRTRRIWMYLPPDYGMVPGKRYPVLYMQDGQNLFDENSSFAGEWGVDEAMNLLCQGGDAGCIIVGIDNGAAHRVDEYSPWVNPAYGGGEGIDYIHFIVNTLKPYIDNNYNTLACRDYTGIMGSSMGGLISMYAIIEFQQVFSKAGVFSPAFWFNGDKTVQHILNTGKLNDVKVFFLAGGQEPPYVTNDMDEVVEAMLTAGFGFDEINVSTPADGETAEWFWKREFPGAYKWLFENAQAAVGTGEVAHQDIAMQVFPNPATDWVRLSGDNLEEQVNISIVGVDGKTWYNGLQQGTQPVFTGDLPRGAYAIAVTDEDGHTRSLKLIHE
jgi:predicted alpha/beta superfamily hydrolase